MNHQSPQWNACAHVNNFFSNLVEFVDFSNLRGATVGCFISFFRINNIELNVCLSGAENITIQDEKAPPSFTSR